MDSSSEPWPEDPTPVPSTDPWPEEDTQAWNRTAKRAKKRGADQVWAWSDEEDVKHVKDVRQGEHKAPTPKQKTRVVNVSFSPHSTEMALSQAPGSQLVEPNFFSKHANDPTILQQKLHAGRPGSQT